MTKALISIDYTVDFVADNGKLTAGAPAQAISETIAQVTEAAFERGDYIFFAIDATLGRNHFSTKIQRHKNGIFLIQIRKSVLRKIRMPEHTAFAKINLEGFSNYFMHKLFL